MKAKELAALLMQHPDSDVVRHDISGAAAPLRKAEVLEWVDTGKVRSAYTHKEAQRLQKSRGPLKQLKNPLIALRFRGD